MEEKWYKFCPHCKTDLKRKPIESRGRLYCPNCDFIFWNDPKPVVSVLLHDDGVILMLQRAKEPFKGYWCLPGGFINYEESPEEAVRREAKEELGVDVVINGLVGVYRINNDPRGIHIDIIYEGKLRGNVRLSSEHQSYKFFTSGDLPEKIAYKHREAINDWLKHE